MPAVRRIPSPAPDPTATRRRGRPRLNGVGAVEEVDLLAMAFAAFAERGYEGTTLRALSRQLGVSHNLINVRFGKKAELWKRAVDWRLSTASRDVASAFEESPDDETNLRHLIHRFCLWATRYADIVGLTYLEGRRSTWRMEYIADRFIFPFKLRLDTLLARVAARRPVSPISSEALMAMLVQGVGYFFGTTALQQRLGAGEAVTEANAPKQAALMADFLLAGLLPTSGR